MTPLRRFLNVLAVVVPHLPAGHALFRIEAARRILAGEEIDSVARALGVRLATAKRQATVLRRGSIQAVVGRQRRATPETVDAQRFRLAQLLLGALTEERFEREKEELTSGRLIIEDHRLGRTDTDYRVLNGGRKPIFRINIKFHGTAFQQARERVGLDPEDCFALATYKIHQALVRQREEALPYVFLVLSCLGITARSVSALIPEDFAWFVAVATRFGKRDIEEAIVALLLTETYRPVLEHRGERIVCLPRVGDAPAVGGEQEDLPARENLSLVAALLRETLIDHFNSIPRAVIGHRPISFLGVNDLVREAVPPGLAAPSWLTILPRYEVDVRMFFFAKREPFLGMALDSRTRRRITASCADLIAAGLRLQGLYVGRLQPDQDPRLEPRLELVGRVAAVHGDDLQLDDAREGITALKADACYPESNHRTVNCLIDQVFGEKAGAIREDLYQAEAARRLGPAKLQDLRKVVGYLQKQAFEVSPGITLKVGSLLGGKTLPSLETAPRPVYVFAPTGAKTDSWADGGIQKYGPYSQQTFSKNRPRIAVVCEAAAKGRVEQFLHKFFNGQRHPKRNPGPFDNGLIGKYRLDGVAPKFFLTESATAAGYQRAAEEAVSDDDRWDLALVQIERGFRELEGADNPYLVTKHAFLTHQTPVQEFTLETASLWEGQLAFALNNMALATYSKLGGTPWLLRCDPAIAHELVIGIGSADVGGGRLGNRERMMGFTTVFSGDGDYRIANRSQAVPKQQYGQALLATLKSTVDTVSQDMNWQDRDHVRLTFHAFKPFRDVEAAAVKSLMESLGRYDVDFAFVEISEDHPYLLFDEAQEGVRDFETKQTKGACAVERGRMLKLSMSEVLLVLTGPRDVKRPEDGLPSPVLLRLHRESTFTDTTYLARQAYAFANHSWRSFFLGSLPVTVLYSQLIAGLLGELGRLPNWNAEVLWGRVGRSRWFL